jgi:hypothetical protein
MVVLLSDAGVEMHGVPSAMTWAIKNIMAPVAKHLFGFQSSFVDFVTSRRHIGGEEAEQQQQRQLVETANDEGGVQQEHQVDEGLGMNQEEMPAKQMEL